jgi:hypothetical protein
MWTLSLLFVVFSGGVLGYLGVSSRSSFGVGMQVLITSLALTFITVGAFVASRRPVKRLGSKAKEDRTSMDRSSELRYYRANVGMLQLLRGWVR